MSEPLTVLPMVQLLFPMGGLGSRFAATGVTTPKPMIPVDGAPMILRAISSFAALRAQQVRIVPIFIVRTEHERDFKLASMLKAVVPEGRIVVLDHDTRGAVETCLVAETAIERSSPLVVCDCDLYFSSKAYVETLLRMADRVTGGFNATSGAVPGGLLVYMESTDARYSYAETGPDGRTVVRTAEKDPISNKALIGAYAFSAGAIFTKAARELLELPIDAAQGRKEYYVSLLFNSLIKDGLRVEAVPHDEYESFGTPEELAAYEAKVRARSGL
jgi:NDP-sugar pyrophosphorylase family protein